MKLSIIMPVYNAERFLEKMVDSILAQTFTDFELFCVDDGSTDSSGKILDAYAEKDSRVKVIHKKNEGAYLARMAAFKICSGEWIGFADSDDVMHPRMYEFLFAAAEKTGAQIAQCNYKELLPDDEPIIEDITLDDSMIKLWDMDKRYDRLISPKVGLTETGVLWSKIYKIELLQNGVMEIPREDVVINAKTLHRAETMCFVDLPLYFYYYRSVSMCHGEYKQWNVNLLNFFYEIERYMAKETPQFEHVILERTVKETAYAKLYSYGTPHKEAVDKLIKENFPAVKKKFYASKKIPFKTKLGYRIKFMFPGLYRRFVLKENGK